MSQVAERTMPVSAQLARYIADFQRAKSPAQPTWVAKARDLALTSFERQGFPTTRLEEWRFILIGPLVETRSSLASDGPHTVRRSFPPIAGDAPAVVCVNGRFAAELSSLKRLPAGIQ